MIIFLNTIMIISSLLFFGGYLYELLFLLDENAAFLSNQTLVSNPITISMYILLLVVCTILIFKKYDGEKMETLKRILSACAGLLFILSGIYAISSGMVSFTVMNYQIFITIISILAGVSFIVLALIETKGMIIEGIWVSFILIFAIGNCIDLVILNAYSIHHIIITYKAVSAIVNLTFLTLYFKSIYLPSKNSNMMLYFSGFFNFIFTGLSYLAYIGYSILNDGFSLNILINNISYVFLGLFSLSVVFALNKNIKQIKNIDDKVAVFDEETIERKVKKNVKIKNDIEKVDENFERVVYKRK